MSPPPSRCPSRSAQPVKTIPPGKGLLMIACLPILGIWCRTVRHFVEVTLFGTHDPRVAKIESNVYQVAQSGHYFTSASVNRPADPPQA